jgi:glycine/D-amino acid oxidase-like deaminating enzyme
MDLKSNEPFWLVKNGLINSYSSLKTDEDCDVLVVGGGITGALIAHQCISDGYRTILIDKREVVNGSSSATTSMLQYEIDIPLFQLMEMIGEEGALASYRACSEAIDTIGEITKKIKSEAGFKMKKSLYYATYKMHVQHLKKEFEARKKAGFRVKWLDPEEILENYGVQGTFGGILSQQGASVDAFKLAHELLHYNRKKGLQIFDKTELIAVDYKRGFNLCRTADGFAIKASKVIYCTGYETVKLVKEPFVKLVNTFAIVSEIDEEFSKAYQNLLIWNTSTPYLYMRTTDDFRFLIGGEDVEFRDPEKRDAMIAQKERKLKAAFEKLFPGSTFHSDFAWAGTFGETKDGLPYIGEHNDFRNSYFVCGFGGNGITFSVAGMQMVSNWLKGKQHELSKWFRFGR